MVVVLFIIGIVAAFLVVSAILHGARGDEMIVTPGKFYVTATVSNGAGRVYTKLAYNPAGQFDTLDACNAWKPDAIFAGAVPKLIETAISEFGPGTQVSFACETPPLPGEHV